MLSPLSSQGAGTLASPEKPLPVDVSEGDLMWKILQELRLANMHLAAISGSDLTIEDSEQ